jgi:hypothetical protein
MTASPSAIESQKMEKYYQVNIGRDKLSCMLANINAGPRTTIEEDYILTWGPVLKPD